MSNASDYPPHIRRKGEILLVAVNYVLAGSMAGLYLSGLAEFRTVVMVYLALILFGQLHESVGGDE